MFSQHIDDLSFALVAPLSPKYYHCLVFRLGSRFFSGRTLETVKAIIDRHFFNQNFRLPKSTLIHRFIYFLNIPNYTIPDTLASINSQAADTNKMWMIDSDGTTPTKNNLYSTEYKNENKCTECSHKSRRHLNSKEKSYKLQCCESKGALEAFLSKVNDLTHGSYHNWC